MNILIRITRPLLRTIILSILALWALGTIKAYSQDNPVRFARSRMSLSEAMEQIDRQTGYSFVYNAGLVDVSTTVEVPAGVSRLSDVIRLLEPQIGYNTITKLNYIIVYTGEPFRPATPAAPRTTDSFTPNDLGVVGRASNPRPAGEELTAGPIHDLDSLTPAPAAYSRIIPADLYSPMATRLPVVALKTNLLYAAAAYTPNLTLEFGVGVRHTVAITGSHNRWNYKSSGGNDKKLLHWTVRPEYRYWLCERYNGHFIGAHAFYASYNISGHKLPMLFERDYRYDGWAVGGGVSYGYHWAFAKKWGLEFEAGAGAAYMDYDRYSCRSCDRNAEPKTKTYIGPTRAGISLVFMIK